MPNPPPVDLTEAIMSSMLGAPTMGIRGQIRQNLAARGNIPPGLGKHFAPERQRPARDDGTLWIVDRIFEPQTLAHFLSFLAGGRLPGGAQTALPTLGEDTILLTEPYSQWSEAPFNRMTQPPIADISARIGSHEDGRRLQVISKELHSMKSRVWEGIVPVSERRWRQKKLDTLENFPAACQLLSSVTNVFHYLNDPRVKNALRVTCNLIHDHLATFELAVNAKRANSSKEPVPVTALWAEFLRAKYSMIENTAHSWVIQRLDAMKAVVLDRIGSYQPTGVDQYDDEQWKLTDMWQDLSENTAHADAYIFIPMDGYKGSRSVSATLDISQGSWTGFVETSGTKPISFSPDLQQRRHDCHLRRRQLSLLATFEFSASAPQGQTTPGLFVNDSAELVRVCRFQSEAQAQARRELRGPPVVFEKPSWVLEVQDHMPWGFVAYRGSHGISDDEWADFVAKFEGDSADWGQGLNGIEDIRARSKIHWLDAKDIGIADGDTDAMKGHFRELRDSNDFKFNKDGFFVADEASIKSYIYPCPDSSPPGDLSGFILWVDANMENPNEERERAEESPGYDGTLRILGSLLWDDFAALMATQTQYDEDLWPLAMHHPLSVYVGPVVNVQRKVWTELGNARASLFSAFQKWQDEHGGTARQSSEAN